jgi:hypothetical protein
MKTLIKVALVAALLVTTISSANAGGYTTVEQRIHDAIIGGEYTKGTDSEYAKREWAAQQKRRIGEGHHPTYAVTITEMNMNELHVGISCAYNIFTNTKSGANAFICDNMRSDYLAAIKRGKVVEYATSSPAMYAYVVAMFPRYKPAGYSVITEKYERDMGMSVVPDDGMLKFGAYNTNESTDLDTGSGLFESGENEIKFVADMNDGNSTCYSYVAKRAYTCVGSNHNGTTSISTQLIGKNELQYINPNDLP